MAVNNPVNPRSYLARGDGSPARFFVDSLVHDAPALRELLRLFGQRRVALGSDYPFPLGEHRPGELIDSLADLSHETRARLLGANAREFLFGERSAG